MTGIPTKHKGRQLRSRLEARWANFFDLVGWRYEYEPFDLPGWTPDFVLFGEEEILVEIKPVSSFPAGIAAEIEESALRWPGEVLILGTTIPIPDASHRTSFGWLADRDWLLPKGTPTDYYGDDPLPEDPGKYTCGWDESVLGRWSAGKGKIGFCHSSNTFSDRISGGHDGGCFGDGVVKPDEIARLWTEAGNRVQWRPPSR